MQQAAVLDFLKELAVGLKSAKSYPPGHPVMEKVVATTLANLVKIFADYPEFSFYFLEKTIIFQDTRFDISKNLAVLSFIEALRKNEIESLTFSSGATGEDVKNLYEVLGSSKLKLKEYGGASEMLQAKGTEKIKINAIKFGIQSGATVQIVQGKQEGAQVETGDILKAIEHFRELIEKGLSAIGVKAEFENIVNSGDRISTTEQLTQAEAVARILENLPSEHRIELLRDIELKPFVLKILSNLSEEKLIELIVTRSEELDGVKKVLGAINENKFSKLLPMLKENIPNIYEYLARIGFLLNEKITSAFSREEIYSTITPYYKMLDSQSARVREEGIKSLATLADRFIRQGHTEIAVEIIQRLSLSLGQEPVPEVINNSLKEIYDLYNVCRLSNQTKLCDVIVDPFNKILSRPGNPIQFKKAVINFMGETANQSVLPALISFLWEAGVYPEVRSAIIKLGKDAVTELLLTLKEAEDYSLRMKIVDILKNIGKDALDILFKNIDASEWYLRRNILSIIGEVGTNEDCPKLEPLINDPDDRVRLELVRTFTKLNYEQGLKALLKDSAIEVRAEALRGLKGVLSEEEIKELLPLFKEKGDSLHAELLRIIGEKRMKDAFQSIVDYIRILELRDDETAQRLKELALSTIIKLAHPELKNVLGEFVHSRDNFLASLSQGILKRYTHF